MRLKLTLTGPGNPGAAPEYGPLPGSEFDSAEGARPHRRRDQKQNDRIRVMPP
jgi:hypothetical protein